MAIKLYRYATLYRPAGLGAVPKYGLKSLKHYDHLILRSGHHAYSTVDYDRELSEKEIYDYELEFVGYVEETA